ncbi:MAG TPA: hypothetical protein VIJ21_01365, partial [Solirubrobacterales bacterium]
MASAVALTVQVLRLVAPAATVAVPATVILVDAPRGVEAILGAGAMPVVDGRDHRGRGGPDGGAWFGGRRDARFGALGAVVSPAVMLDRDSGRDRTGHDDGHQPDLERTGPGAPADRGRTAQGCPGPGCADRFGGATAAAREGAQQRQWHDGAEAG